MNILNRFCYIVSPFPLVEFVSRTHFFAIAIRSPYVAHMIRTLYNVCQAQFVIDSCGGGGASQLRNECNGGMRMLDNCDFSRQQGHRLSVHYTHPSLSVLCRSLFFIFIVYLTLARFAGRTAKRVHGRV